jgi:hypothetical protein
MRQARAKARWDLYQPEHARVLTHPLALARPCELEQSQQREQQRE